MGFPEQAIKRAEDFRRETIGADYADMVQLVARDNTAFEPMECTDWLLAKMGDHYEPYASLPYNAVKFASLIMTRNNSIDSSMYFSFELPQSEKVDYFKALVIASWSGKYMITRSEFKDYINAVASISILHNTKEMQRA